MSSACYLQIKLVNIRAEDIVDSNPKLTLGLIWTIILHFQVSFYQITCSFSIHPFRNIDLLVNLINRIDLIIILVISFYWPEKDYYIIFFFKLMLVIWMHVREANGRDEFHSSNYVYSFDWLAFIQLEWIKSKISATFFICLVGVWASAGTPFSRTIF